MSRTIQHQDLSHLAETSEVLPGEIDGLRTWLHVVPSGESEQMASSGDVGRAYLFVAGTGTVTVGEERRAITEVAFLAPRPGQSLSMTAGAEGLRVLELALELTETDRAEAEAQADRLPHFVTYGEAPTYRERIKSPKTTSRTLLPEHTFPRLCVGSVQTTGDDRVAAHEHPMLEQLFYGLTGNDCVVQADEARFDFGADVLLHIPLGSMHGVEVVAPRTLHYVWIDVFRDRSGMDWIVQEHIPDGDGSDEGQGR